MSRIPFTVSARAARLIGRENVATSQGAITELVKNAYDADAKVCAILFVPSNEPVSEILSERRLAQLVSVYPGADALYAKSDAGRRLKADSPPEALEALAAAFAQLPELWIIDNGHGMAAKTIEDLWMVIGTDTKEYDGISEGGRIMTGAKGIGRFALDRLGQESELFSAKSSASSLAHWIVDWGDFEGRGKVITDVEAILDEEDTPLASIYAANHLAALLPNYLPTRDDDVGAPVSFDKGSYPRLCLNQAAVYLTDTAYGLRLKEGCTVRGLCFSFYNTLTLLFAETDGRFYGGGVLELSPTEFRGLPIVYHEPNDEEYSAFLDVHEKARGNPTSILDFGDRWLAPKIGLEADDMRRLREAWRALRTHRLRHSGRLQPGFPAGVEAV